MFVVLDPPARREPQTINFYGCPLSFDFYEVDGVRKLAARVPDTASRMAEIRRLINARPNMRLVKDRDVTPIENDRRAFGSAPDNVSPKAGLTTAALTKGWTFADLVGTGNGEDPGEGGGRSTRTGLTLAEMGMLPPPADWARQAETAWPWQCVGFSALPGWKHPDLGSKAVDKEEEEEEGASAPYLTDSPPKDEVGTSDASVDEDEDEDEDEAPAAVDPAVEAGYPASDLDEARALAHKLAQDRGTTDYHPNALNFFLRKQKLDTVGKAELKALLAVAPK